MLLSILRLFAIIQFIDEMRKPADYMKSLALLQGTDMVLYLVVGLVVALYVGEQAVSPALGNLSPTLARVACESCRKLKVLYAQT